MPSSAARTATGSLQANPPIPRPKTPGSDETSLGLRYRDLDRPRMALRVRLQRGGVLLLGRALCLDAEIDHARHRVGQFDRLPRVGADLVDQFLRRSPGDKNPDRRREVKPG